MHQVSIKGKSSHLKRHSDMDFKARRMSKPFLNPSDYHNFFFHNIEPRLFQSVLDFLKCREPKREGKLKFETRTSLVIVDFVMPLFDCIILLYIPSAKVSIR